MKPYPLAPEKYRVSENGDVYSSAKNSSAKKRGGKLVGAIRKKDGRRQYLLFIDGKRVYKQAHVMVLETYVGPRPVGMEGCHNDGDYTNNYVSNLRWDTRSANKQDMRAHGTYQEGERHGRCLTTETQVRELRSLRKAGTTLADAARVVGIPYSRAWMIDTGKNWKHVT